MCRGDTKLKYSSKNFISDILLGAYWFHWEQIYTSDRERRNIALFFSSFHIIFKQNNQTAFEKHMSGVNESVWYEDKQHNQSLEYFPWCPIYWVLSLTAPHFLVFICNLAHSNTYFFNTIIM